MEAAKRLGRRNAHHPFFSEFRPNTSEWQNRDTLDLLKRITERIAPASEDDKRQLAGFSGFGIMANDLGEKEPGWRYRHNMTEAEWLSAKGSSLTGYYTPVALVRSMWSLLANLGFTGGKVLDPSFGIGHFVGGMPDGIYDNSEITAVECDLISVKIARILYPEVTLHSGKYEDKSLGQFDLIVSNIPFGDYPVFDEKFLGKPEEKFCKSIHGYYFARSLNQVRDGGLVAFVTSRYFMDGVNADLRNWIAERADLVSAFRLPEKVFAGTEVVADVVVLRKRMSDEEPNGVAWSSALDLEIGRESFPVNEYFMRNPSAVLGKFAVKSGKFGPTLTVDVSLSSDEIISAISSAGSPVYIEVAEGSAPAVALAKSTVKDGHLYTVGSDLFLSIDGYAHPVSASPAVVAKVSGLIEIAGVLTELVEHALNGVGRMAEFKFDAMQRKLNQVYDAFCMTHGAINDPSNVRAFRQDARLPLLRSIEHYDTKTKIAQKGDIFSKRTLNRVTYPDKSDSAADALQVSLSRYGKINLTYICRLTNKGETQVIEELDGKMFFDPQSDAWVSASQYLCGNIAEKISLAKSRGLDGNVAALESVMPAPLDPEEITVGLGATWVAVGYVDQFVNELLSVDSTANNMEGDPRPYRPSRDKVTVARAHNEWIVDQSSALASWRDEYKMAHDKWGTSRASAVEIIDDILNSRESFVFDRDAKGARTVNQPETAAVREKRSAIEKTWREWVWKDPTRRDDLVRTYNAKFNVFVEPALDGSHMVFPGMTSEISLKPHQKTAVWRALQGGNLLLWHMVGAGKTYELICSAMEARRLGVRHKPMHVVPNHLLDQYVTEFTRLYPLAKLLVIDTDGMSPANLKVSLSRIATGDWDSVVLTQASFVRIPVSNNLWMAFVDAELDLIADLLEYAKREGKRISVKALEKTKKRLEAGVRKRAAEAKSRELKGILTWEQMGVDMLIVDESDMYRNLAYNSNLTLPGINKDGSTFAYDMYIKSQWITRRCERGHVLGDRINCSCGAKRARGQVVFATGTALVNSVAELHAVQRYLQMDDLINLGLVHFDAWAKQFGDAETVIEMKPSGKGWRQNTRFVRFNNVPDLWRILSSVCDAKLDPEKLGLLRPKVYGGQPIGVEIEPTTEMLDYIDLCAKRAENLDPRDPSADNILAIMGDASKAALDMRLVVKEIEDQKSSKINTVVSEIYRIWKEAKDAGVIRTQAVFLDIGTPGGSTLNLYADMKAKLVSLGIPSREVVFAHDGKTDAERKAIFDRINTGEAKVIFGSTSKMGTGVNMQRYLYALHEVDAPWTPRSVEQREGRILRQGNTNAVVYIYRYVTRKSMDFYRWHLIELKAKFIQQFVSGSLTERSVQDLETVVLSFSQMRAMATGDETLIEQVKLQADMTRLHNLYTKWSADRRTAVHIVENYPSSIRSLNARLAEYKEAEQIIRTDMDRTLVMGGKSYTEDEAAELLTTIYKEGERGNKFNMIFGPVSATVWVEFNIVGERECLGCRLSVGKTVRTVGLVRSGRTNLSRIMQTIEETPLEINRISSMIARTESEHNDAVGKKESDFPHMDQMIATRKRLDEIAAMLADATKTNVVDEVDDQPAENVSDSVGK
jgi:N12 class adenine-specific DNA methylase